MKFKAAQIAAQVGGTVEGDSGIEVHRVDRIEEAGSGSLAFLANMKYAPHLYTTGASVVLIPEDYKLEKTVNSTLIRVPDPYSAFAELLRLYEEQKASRLTGVSPQAYIHPKATIGENCYVGEFAWIGENVVIGDGTQVYPHVYIGDDCRIGDQTVLYSGVKVYRDCRVGSECILHSGVVIGADGFGFAVQSDQKYLKVPQTGNVVIEDFVEIGANSTVDRATLGSTIVRKGVKLDNLVQVAHNVEIGSDTVIAAQTGISGSVKIGSRCLIAGQVGFVGHIEIADDVTIGAQTGIARSVREPGTVLLGSPAMDASLYKRVIVWFRRLPDLGSRLSALEKKVKE